MLLALHDRVALRAWLRRDLSRQLYLIGDLDESQWSRCQWFGWSDPGGELQAVALLYLGFQPPTLLAFAEPEDQAMRALLCALRPLLPARFLAHLPPGSQRLFLRRSGWEGSPQGRFLRMMLPPEVPLPPGRGRPLESEELPLLQAFYEQHHPRYFLDPRWVEQGHYWGCFDPQGQLIAAGGVHVHSRSEAVAALGNIAVHSEHRRRGLGRSLTAALCHQLRGEGLAIGLNVDRELEGARRCYRGLGFQEICEHEEWLLERPAAGGEPSRV